MKRDPGVPCEPVGSSSAFLRFCQKYVATPTNTITAKKMFPVNSSVSPDATKAMIIATSRSKGLASSDPRRCRIPGLMPSVSVACLVILSYKRLIGKPSKSKLVSMPG
ncbi:hypothetical protein D3C72_818000 [compost metagenome]